MSEAASRPAPRVSDLQAVVKDRAEGFAAAADMIGKLLTAWEEGEARIRELEAAARPYVRVAGETCTRSLAAMVRGAEYYLAAEQAKPLPDNGLIALLCDLVRLCREYHGDTLVSKIAELEAAASAREPVITAAKKWREADVSAANALRLAVDALPGGRPDA